MKTGYMRILSLLVIALFASCLVAQPPPDNPDPNPGGGDGSGCQACHAWSYGGQGVTYMSCTSPEPGGWGKQFCRIESYPEATYCFVDGHDCCVD
jgi:hypothetical protein